MRVGVFLGDFNPDVGGGFTFQDDLFRAFASVSGNSPHDFTILGTADALEMYVKSVSTSDNLQAERIKIGWFDKVVESLKVYSPLIRRILRWPGPVQRVADRLGLDCLWYVGGGAYEATDVPYVATVWDLQHRLTPWFPEMSARGTWDARESAYRNFLQRASYVITGTNVGKDEIKLCYEVSEERVRILPHPTPAFALSEPQGFYKGTHQCLGVPEKYLLYPAQFWPHKNHINLLKALKVLRDRFGIALPLVLVGSDKGNADYVRAFASSLEIGDQVRFSGFVSQEELLELYRGASMLVYPSMCGPENLPPLEAFALGCVVAAADVPGAKEQLGDAAILFNPIDPDDIAEKIWRLFNDEKLISELRCKGMARAKSWTAREFSESILELFDNFSAIRCCWPSRVL